MNSFHSHNSSPSQSTTLPLSYSSGSSFHSCSRFRYPHCSHTVYMSLLHNYMMMHTYIHYILSCLDCCIHSVYTVCSHSCNTPLPHSMSCRPYSAILSDTYAAQFHPPHYNIRTLPLYMMCLSRSPDNILPYTSLSYMSNYNSLYHNFVSLYMTMNLYYLQNSSDDNTSA